MTCAVFPDRRRRLDGARSADALRAHPSLRQTLTTDDPELLPAVLGLDLEHAEGWFFPDTYRFPRGTSDTQLLRQAYQLMAEKLASAWAERAVGLPFSTPYEALILASVVERETGLDAERSRVAGVFVRRLERGMRLQTDPTVIYGLGTAYRRQPHAQRSAHRHAATTPTPARACRRRPSRCRAKPRCGLRCNPVTEDALYFVATGLPDGSHTFSATLEEHNAAVAVYLARLRTIATGAE